MDLMDMHQTIAAVATPPGHGGVGIVRLSGQNSHRMLAAMFHSARPTFGGFKPYRLHYGRIVNYDGRKIDEVLAVTMPGPGSFTGEDMAEIHCHGGRAILDAVLTACCSQGARLARHGEFSYRAWRNGKLDLTQAEAIAEIIAAPTHAALHLAQIKLSGALGRKIVEINAGLKELKTQLCLAVDFPEEDINYLQSKHLVLEAERLLATLDTLLLGVKRARAWREGALVVLHGRVNTGKSSLLNALSGRERAIVSESPGTTRDWLEESINLDGLPVRLVDTAGLRCTENIVENQGLEKSRNLVGQADLVLFLVDGSLPLAEEDIKTLHNLATERILILINKDDLQRTIPWPGDILAQDFEILVMSVKTGVGLESLAKRIRERVIEQSPEPETDVLVPNLRQAQILERARLELIALIEETYQGLTYDLLGLRLDAACEILTEITGEIATSDVLETIFNRFCIGK